MSTENNYLYDVSGNKLFTELMEELIVLAGGDVSALPDRLETTYLKLLGEALGVNMSNLPDNLVSTHLQAIIDGTKDGI